MRRLRAFRTGAALALLLGQLVVCGAQENAVGEALYRRGEWASGEVLRGEREGGVSVAGAAAACATCHRESGLGSREGRIVVPPIIGKYLFRPHATNVQDMSLPHVAGYRSTREPYTAETLARAIREGIGPNGRRFNYLMPRYELDDASMASLTRYLEALSNAAVPGVTDDVLHFATIITADADPVERRGVLDVMERFFDDKNAFIRGGQKPMRASREIEYRVSRRWQLHVWQLTGPPEDWERQLQALLAREPVFAVLSGLGGRTWAPVHRFCQAARMPCLLPNVVLPLAAEQDFYPVYFSRGVLLEADLAWARVDELRQASQASALVPTSQPSIKRVLQIYRAGDVGEEAANAFAARAANSNLIVESRRLAASDRTGADVAATIKGISPNDVLMLWLRPADLARLPNQPAASAATILSGLMGGMEHAPLAPAWRATSLITYPADLPSARSVRMNFPLLWFKIRHINVVAERVQTDTYVACGILAETLTDMLDSFVRDYLVERVEGMLSHRLVNGYYPRLGLAPGQRFASKGGYLVRFSEPVGDAVVGDGAWTTP